MRRDTSFPVMKVRKIRFYCFMLQYLAHYPDTMPAKIWYCVTDNVTGQILQYATGGGFTVDASQTIHADCGPIPRRLDKRYFKIVAGRVAEMTSGEKTVVDVAKAVADSVTSKRALHLQEVYATVADLPAVPRTSGLMVRVEDTGAGKFGWAMSGAGQWAIFEPRA